MEISIPKFSPQNDTFFPGPQIAPVGISDPTFTSRSDLWYVPTLRTFLLYNRFFYSEVRGAEVSGLTCGQKRQIPGKFPAISREISPQFHGKFPRHFPGIFPGFFRGK